MKKLYTLALAFIGMASASAQITYPDFKNDSIVYYGLNTNEGFYTGKAGAFSMAIDDADYNVSQGRSKSDAYDGAFNFALSFYDATNGVVDSAYTNNNYAGSYTQTGNNFQYDAENIGGLDVSVGYYFKPMSNIVTVVYKIANNTASAKTAAAKVGTNYGSDGNTQLDSSSTGDQGVSVAAPDAARWTITSDGTIFDPVNPDRGDPINTMVRQGTGTLTSQAYYKIAPGNGEDYDEDSFYVSIPANSYRYIVMFNRLDSTVADAKAAIKAANGFNEAYVTTQGLLGSLVSASDVSKIANWNFAPAVTAVNNATDISNTVNAFPNPTNGELNLNINNDVTGTLLINVMDNNGVVKLSTAINKNTSNMDTTIDMSALAAGLYIVEMKQEGVVARKKVSKF